MENPKNEKEEAFLIEPYLLDLALPDLIGLWWKRATLEKRVELLRKIDCEVVFPTPPLRHMWVVDPERNLPCPQ